MFPHCHRLMASVNWKKKKKKQNQPTKKLYNENKKQNPIKDCLSIFNSNKSNKKMMVQHNSDQ